MSLQIFLLGIIYSCFSETYLEKIVINGVDSIGVHKSCFGEIGCITTTDEWFHAQHRPRNLEPLERHTIRTEFILITKYMDGKSLDYNILFAKDDSLTLGGYNRNKGLVLLIHDFTSNGRTGWIKHIASSLHTKLNIVSVDWEAGAEPPFEQAIANARVVALEIESFIRAVQGNCSRHAIHIIGHGVGAHIAGYVGNCLKVTKITGLDPTGPLFENMHPVVRLDPSDAMFVEVLHTDAFNSRSQGARNRLGHVDFYINNALNQPGCNENTAYPGFTRVDRNSLKEGQILPACSHKRSFKYYVEAIQKKNCEFVGILCESYEKFANGECTTCVEKDGMPACASFGGNITNLVSMNHGLYLNTRGEPPYCLNSYSVKIYIERNPKGKLFQDGKFEIIMINDQGVMVQSTAYYWGIKKLDHRFEAGKDKTLIYYAPEPRMERIQEARLKWIYKNRHGCIFCKTTSIFVKKVTINLLSFRVCDVIDNDLYPECDRTEIESGSYVVFKKLKTKDVVISKPCANCHKCHKSKVYINTERIIKIIDNIPADF